MIRPRYMPLVWRQLWRHRTRSLLTLGGVATAMFLFVAVQSMQRGVEKSTVESAKDTTLVVYREDRFCPFTSRLPEYYLDQIKNLSNVRTVTPMRVVVNNCRASLDVVTFRGVPRDTLDPNSFNVIDGSIPEWQRRSDAALLGETLAKRRGLNVGDRFDAAGVTAYVAGILRSDEPQEQNVAYVHLDFLQHTVDKKLGTVTQFNVKVDDPSKLADVSESIDQLFRRAEHPTSTRSEKAFVALVASDMIELVGFTRYLGWGCLIAIFALLANAIVLSVQNRVQEHAILQTLGYRGTLIGRLVLTEGLLLGAVGGGLGTLIAIGAIRFSHLSLSVDGLSIPIEADAALMGVGLVASMLLGAGAGFVPAWQAGRKPIAACFRAT